MPTITVDPKDLWTLLDEELPEAEFVRRLAAVKGEHKGVDEATGHWRIELNDTNRPDLWCTEGIARQIRSLREGKSRDYPVFQGKPAKHARITVDANLREVRPYIAAVRASGVAVTDAMLVALIQTQEKLAEGYGKKRRDVSVGLYNARKVRWPVAYKGVKRDAVKFVPLGFDVEMTPGEILERHPKGQAYRAILDAAPVVPILQDAEGVLLSLAPIINSRALGEVKAGDDDLMVEVTGTNLRSVILVCNIFAANLTDRGFTCEPVQLSYPYNLEAVPNPEFTRTPTTPHAFTSGVTLELGAMEKLLGEKLAPADVEKRLVAYGCDAKGAGKGRLQVTPPPWRMDYMHWVDALEDYAMARGFDSFERQMAIPYTVGGVHETTTRTDRVRDHLIGCGFEETIGNVLIERRIVWDQVRAPLDKPARPEPVALANPTSELVGVMRDALLPGLLRLEGASPRATYPHRIFEVGEVQVADPAHPHGSHTEWHAAALWAAPAVAFSDLHALLEALSRFLGWKASLEPADRGIFIPGRAGRIQFAGQPAGFVGEVHPEVLESFGIRMPAVGFEVALARVPEMST